MVKCQYCGECTEDAPRGEHNRFCPNQYPFEECRNLAIADWKKGFNFTGTIIEDTGTGLMCGFTSPEEPAIVFFSPVAQLGFKMNPKNS